MNERIKELMIEAGYAAPEITGRANEFAKLIIKECTKELEISKKCDIYTGELFDFEWNDCVDYQIKMLKEHFGVTE